MEVSELTTLLHRCWGAGAGMQWGVAGPVATAGRAMRRITSGEGLFSLLCSRQQGAFWESMAVPQRQQRSGATRDGFFLAVHSLFLATGLSAPSVSEKPG